MACGILVSWPGVESRPSAMTEWNPNHCTARGVPTSNIFNQSHAVRTQEPLVNNANGSGGWKGIGSQLSSLCQKIWFTELCLKFLCFNWSTVALQYCINFCCMAKWFIYTYYMHSFLNSFPLWSIIGYWIQSPVLYSRILWSELWLSFNDMSRIFKI